MTETAQVLEARPTCKQAKAMRAQSDISRVGYNDVLIFLVGNAETLSKKKRNCKKRRRLKQNVRANRQKMESTL